MSHTFSQQCDYDYCRMINGKETTHLAVTTYDHLFASEHDICGSLQTTDV